MKEQVNVWPRRERHSTGERQIKRERLGFASFNASLVAGTVHQGPRRRRPTLEVRWASLRLKSGGFRRGNNQTPKQDEVQGEEEGRGGRGRCQAVHNYEWMVTLFSVGVYHIQQGVC